ncbi:Ubiquitin-specific protease [Trachipleistophora hominis]|uniref:Ubiquitin carboxyl-terminal hydrolase n=1 Tax=Trachipleistophora hominis TaxID=72359 RepID=L7JVQ7_TRAHO|nr:Ubiquitin-specific protease [Trachipleistophora hominis]
MEGCSHLTSYKKHKEKYLKIVGCKKRLMCTVCGSRFNIHMCLVCERMFCFPDHLAHDCGVDKEREECVDDRIKINGGKHVMDVKRSVKGGEKLAVNSVNMGNGTESNGNEKGDDLLVLDDIEATIDEDVENEIKECVESDTTNDKVADENGKSMAMTVINTSIELANKFTDKRSIDGQDASKRARTAGSCVLFVNKRYGCVYCIECQKYLFFTKLLEIFVNIKYRIKNQKNYLRMHCSYPKGIINLGNTCYINSILQVFFNTGILKKCFFDTMHEKVLCKNEKCIVCALKNMYMECYNLHSLIVPNEFLYILWSISSVHYSSRQFDAHEFFLDLCELLHKNFFTDPDRQVLGNENTVVKCKCVIHRVFCGVLNSTLTCLKCGCKSVKEENFYSISIGIRNQKSVNDALAHFFTEESLGESVLCQHCERKEPFLKEMSVASQPPILVLHLKRFQMNKNDAVKDNTVLNFSHLVECCTLKSNDSRVYRLFGMVCHVGTLEYGHYFTFLRVENTWKRFDDERITDANENDMCDCSPYILFYELE